MDVYENLPAFTESDGCHCMWCNILCSSKLSVSYIHGIGSYREVTNLFLNHNGLCAGACYVFDHKITIAQCQKMSFMDFFLRSLHFFKAAY